MGISKVGISKSFIFRHLFLIIVILSIGGGFYFYKYVNDVKLNRITDVSELVRDKKSKHYINDLYISDGRNYEYILDDNEKEIYNQLLTAIKKFQKKVTIELNDEKYKDFYLSGIILEKIQEVMIMDHPELLQFAYFKLEGGNSKERKYQVTVEYALNKSQYNTAVKRVKAVLDQAAKATSTMNDYEKAKYVYDWIGKKNTYSSSQNLATRSAYSALVTGKAINTAYAKAAQLMLQYIKVNSILVSGTYKELGYEWNLVKIEGKYYHFDTTVTNRYKRQAGIIYTGFLFKNKPDYVLEYKKMVPRVNGKKYEYYAYNNFVYKYNKNQGFDDLEKLLNETKSNVVQLKIKNYSEFYRDASIAKANLKFDAIYFMDEVAIIIKKIKN